MKSVGVRELKNRLSQYLREVRAGERVVVTDRGDVVAELTPPGAESSDGSVPMGLRTLARQGLVTLGVPGASAETYPPLRLVRKPRRTSRQWLDEERGPR
jgi:prevent-host-death family protein